MTFVMQLSFLFGDMVAGWFVARHEPAAARRTIRWMATLAGLLLLSLAVSGWLDGPGPVHRWSGHGMVILLWLCLPFAAGVALQQLPRRPVAALGRLGALLLLLVMALYTSFTGYLGPSGGDGEMPEETRNRFLVLHCFLMPAVVGGLLLEWRRSAAPVAATDQDGVK